MKIQALIVLILYLRRLPWSGIISLQRTKNHTRYTKQNKTKGKNLRKSSGGIYGEGSTVSHKTPGRDEFLPLQILNSFFLQTHSHFFSAKRDHSYPGVLEGTLGKSSQGACACPFPLATLKQPFCLRSDYQIIYSKPVSFQSRLNDLN